MRSFHEFAQRRSANKEFYDRVTRSNMVPAIDPEEYPNREREGLEGPFRAKNGLVVYYDPKEGKYYDPKSDMYIYDNLDI